MTISCLARRALLLCVVLFSTGCLGAGYIRRSTYEDLQELRHPNTPERRPGEVLRTKAEVLAVLGPPRTTRREGEHEIWTYRTHIAVHGAYLIVVVVPVPLMVPFGYRKRHLRFVGDSLTSVMQEFGEPVSVSCGLSWDVSAGHGGYGWGWHCGKN